MPYLIVLSRLCGYCDSFLSFLSGGFEHVLKLLKLKQLRVDGFWDAFDGLPSAITAAGGLREKLAYLQEQYETSMEPLM